MAEPQSDKAPSLEEQYSLDKVEKADTASKPEEAKEVESPVKADSENAGETPAAVEETTEEKPVVVVVVEDSSEAAPAATEESSETAPAATEESSEGAPAATEESSEAAEEENSGDQDVAETREIKLETAPADFRFPTTNQTRHCFTRYIEYHRCVAAKGEGATECDKFAKYYRSLCPTEWVERWNEQRESGTFPGPL